MVFTPDYVIHPWESLAEALADRQMTQWELALRAGITEKHINQIINWKSPISPETAIKLERVLGISMSFWNNLQKNYEETVAKLDAERSLLEEISLFDNFKLCYKELVDKNYLQPVTSKTDKYKQLLNFFWVDSLAYVQNVESMAFRKTPNKDVDWPALSAWLRVWILEYNKQALKSFDEKKLKESMDELRNIMINWKSWFWAKLTNLLNECWVWLVCTKYFSHTYVNGVARRVWNNPLIQLSLRGKSRDILCFTFFHELWHILLHGKKDQFIDYEWDNYQNDPKELEANKFASNILIPPVAYIKFVRQWDFKFTSIMKFAHSIQTDSWVVAWRLAKDWYITWPVANKYRKQISLGKTTN